MTNRETTMPGMISTAVLPSRRNIWAWQYYKTKKKLKILFSENLSG